MTVAPYHTKSRPRMLDSSKATFLEFFFAEWHLEFKWILDQMGRERSINLSVYLLLDLEAGRFKFLDENLLGAGTRLKATF